MSGSGNLVRGGFKPTIEKAEQIDTLQIPNNRKQVRQSLGIVNYYRKFIPEMVVMADNICFVKDQKKWAWNNLEEKALTRIKETIRRRDALAPFKTRSGRKVKITSDVCDEGMGAVLEQEQEDGGYKPVLYWSSLFQAYERNYTILEKEALACVAAYKNSESIF